MNTATHPHPTRIEPKFQAGELVRWGDNRHRVLAIDCISLIGGELKVYYKVQAIEGRCAYHKPVQASEDVLKSI